MIGLTYPNNNKKKVSAEYLRIGSLETKVITHKKGIVGVYAYIDDKYSAEIYESIWTESSGIDGVYGFLTSAVYDSQLGQLTIKVIPFSDAWTSHVIVFYYE